MSAKQRKEFFYDICQKHNMVRNNREAWVPHDVSKYVAGENIIEDKNEVFYMNIVECDKCKEPKKKLEDTVRKVNVCKKHNRLSIEGTSNFINGFHIIDFNSTKLDNGFYKHNLLDETYDFIFGKCDICAEESIALDEEIESRR